jgi:hypothetical protein
MPVDAYLEEELYDLLTFCIQNSESPQVDDKKQRVQEIGRELFADGGDDALENMFFSIEHRIKDEISGDARPYRAWWNGISAQWSY